ncbi:chymotrypsin-like protease CTRL-1 [Menidia menidia]|uniref:chymotrypsin n=1 Tax=Menidia menidia TaxID=238744 RepID=A0A8S4BNZ1_9TELE|nr:unnamed protein product [Menidia menidia]
MFWLIGCFALVVPALGCGVPAIEPQISGFNKIVNGETAVSGSWPWQVSIQDTMFNHFCGGSLVNQYWVVTAAHCRVSKISHRVVLGEHDFEFNSEHIQRRIIAKIFTHPNYNPSTFNNDIALLKLSHPAQMTNRVSPVCLASSMAVIHPGTQCVTTGWGKTGQTSTPRYLQQTALPVISPDMCRSYWGYNRITDAMICAGAAGMSSCQGDSGGPLVCLRGGSWGLVGIVSWGSSSCDVHTPAVYTKVPHLRGWIDQTIGWN